MARPSHDISVALAPTINASTRYVGGSGRHIYPLPWGLPISPVECPIRANLEASSDLPQLPPHHHSTSSPTPLPHSHRAFLCSPSQSPTTSGFHPCRSFSLLRIDPWSPPRSHTSAPPRLRSAPPRSLNASRRLYAHLFSPLARVHSSRPACLANHRFDTSGHKLGFRKWHSNQTNIDRTNTRIIAHCI